MKKTFISFLFFLFFTSHSYACALLQVPIGTPVSVAKGTFDFLDSYSSQTYGKNTSARFSNYAIDYCENSPLENADLEVIVYDSKIAGINLISSDSEFKKEIYEFTKYNITDPGEEFSNENYLGYKDISIGGLLILYTRLELRDEIVEVLEITNNQMSDYTIGEEIIDVTG